MREAAKEIGEIIEIFKNDFTKVSEETASVRVAEDKWTLKEIIGHLIDSASNNHQRFVRLQLTEELEFPDYKRDKWLSIENHQNMKFSELLTLFYYYNILMINIVSTVNEKCLKNKWNINWDENTTFFTLENLIIHYVNHMKTHLSHFRERLMETEDFMEDKKKH